MLGFRNYAFSDSCAARNIHKDVKSGLTESVPTLSPVAWCLIKRLK